MNCRQLCLHRHLRHCPPSSSLSSLLHHAFEGMNRKWKRECSALHRYSIHSGRVYTDAEVQEKLIATILDVVIFRQQ